MLSEIGVKECYIKLVPAVKQALDQSITRSISRVKANVHRLSKSKMIIDTHLLNKKYKKEYNSYIHTPMKYYRETMFDKKNKYYKNNYSIEAKHTTLPSQVLLSKIIKSTKSSTNTSVKNSCKRIRAHSRYQAKVNHFFAVQQLVIRSKLKTKPMVIQIEAINNKLTRLKNILSLPKL